MTVRRVLPFLLLHACLIAFCATLTGCEARSSLIRGSLEDGSRVHLREGRGLFFEFAPGSRQEANELLERYVALPEVRERYRNVRRAAIPFYQLTPEGRRAALLGVFEDDYVTEEGWRHTVVDRRETLRALSEWLTGDGWNAQAIREANNLSSAELRVGQSILVPQELLLDVMRAPTPERIPESAAAPAVADQVQPLDWLETQIAQSELTYEDGYAIYRLKSGEALYTAVVVRFTDYRENEDILQACERVIQASGIGDVTGMQPGQRIRIPRDMLSSRFQPPGTPERERFEESLREARTLQGQVQTDDLEGVVVILDPGHGGRDHGAVNREFALYEDQINYDIAVRIRNILLAQTAARVHLTVYSPSQSLEPTNRRRFEHRTDEVLLTTPVYSNHDARVSVNLRWALANSIYRQELAQGVDPMKVVFTSIHTDALFNQSLRGAMVYIPGAHLRRDREDLSGAPYNQFEEVRERNYAASTPGERRRDEALSRNFANAILEALGRHQVKRFDMGDPIRNQIRQDGGRVYVPGVLRNTEVPTKVLIECANLLNPTDCERLGDPSWRQRFAEAYVDALRDFYGG